MVCICWAAGRKPCLSKAPCCPHACPVLGPVLTRRHGPHGPQNSAVWTAWCSLDGHHDAVVCAAVATVRPSAGFDLGEGLVPPHTHTTRLIKGQLHLIFETQRARQLTCCLVVTQLSSGPVTVADIR